MFGRKKRPKLRRETVTSVRKAKKNKSEVHILGYDSEIRAHLDFDKDWADTIAETKSDMLDKHLVKLSRLLGMHMDIRQLAEKADARGTGNAFGHALTQIIDKRHGEGRFLKGKNVFSNGMCSTLFKMQTSMTSEIGSLDIRTLGGVENEIDKDLQDFLIGLCSGTRFHYNIVVEKVDDKKHEWDSVFESMAGSMKKILDKGY